MYIVMYMLIHSYNVHMLQHANNMYNMYNCKFTYSCGIEVLNELLSCCGIDEMKIYLSLHNMMSCLMLFMHGLLVSLDYLDVKHH